MRVKPACETRRRRGKKRRARNVGLADERLHGLRSDIHDRDASACDREEPSPHRDPPSPVDRITRMLVVLNELERLTREMNAAVIAAHRLQKDHLSAARTRHLIRCFLAASFRPLEFAEIGFAHGESF